MWTVVVLPPFVHWKYTIWVCPGPRVERFYLLLSDTLGTSSVSHAHLNTSARKHS